ncbi:MAG: 2,3-bisphosphoglycerate-independent phosphoglycerate mutase [Magnetococcales bacterium]|nr:2,3-bisphosphoglycerate-independent phosphoglycerate mutase [Magnetococcales bacterium]NGZ27935.1 2,3-bisphosphoglycerate-independent phosphoglycerate mutase [Magnetococcales bacterium]
MKPTPMALIILDGWGMAPPGPHNAIHHAHTPNFDLWWQEKPTALLETSANAVGLPAGQMGNSEVGHMNMGAGRVVYQDFTRISLAVENGSFGQNPAIVQGIQAARELGGSVHIFGLLSPGGVHSHTDHLLAAVAAAKQQGVNAVYIHAFLDGRDTPPRSALGYLSDFEQGLAKIGCGMIATVCGRYYAMDRDKRWERVAKAYAMLVAGEGRQATNAHAAVENGYALGEDDEFISPTVVVNPEGAPLATIQDGDTILVMNFRADRVREISHAFTDGDSFTGFARARIPKLAAYVCLTQYDETLQNVLVAYPPDNLNNTMGEILSQKGLSQLRAAETEKFAHVTYFFNGGREPPFPGEERILIPSPKVATYDQQPEMSAPLLTQTVVEHLEKNPCDFLLLNFANPDMVGHTGDFAATLRALETVDHCLGILVNAILKAGGEVLITADHGNADHMVEESTGQPHTAHTLNPAPLIYLGRKATLKNGKLCDLAPTLLHLMGIPQPMEMEGQILVTLLP